MLSPADADLARRDPALPGLATLLDAESLLGELHAALPHLDLGEGRLTYLRYKPGTNCLAGYEIDVAGRPLAIYAKTYRTEARAKLRRALEEPGVEGPLGPGLVALEAPVTIVWAFPNDAKLPAMAHLANGRSRESLIWRLLPEHAALGRSTLTALRYKPERRYVARITSGGGREAVLKFHSSLRYGAALLGARGFVSRGALRVASLLGDSYRDRVLAHEWLPGRPLVLAMNDPDWVPELVQTVGAALATLHAQRPTELPSRAPDAEGRSLFAVTEAVGQVCPGLRAEMLDLAGRLAPALARAPEVQAPVHGDFYAKQVLIDDEVAGFLDFDQAGYGDPAADLGLFIAHLERDVLRNALSRRRAEAVRGALLDGYRAQTGALPDRIELHAAAGLLRLAPDPFRDREPDWPGRTAHIVQRAETLLEGSIRWSEELVP